MSARDKFWCRRANFGVDMLQGNLCQRNFVAYTRLWNDQWNLSSAFGENLCSPGDV